MIGNFKQVKKELDSIGCGFCLAKWTQVTIHLSPLNLYIVVM